MGLSQTPKALVPASIGGMTLLNAGGTTLTGASVTISSIPDTYKNLQLIVRNLVAATDDAQLFARYNSDSNARNAYGSQLGIDNINPNNTSFQISSGQDNAVGSGLIVLDIYDYANTTTWKCGTSYGFTINATTTTKLNFIQNFHAYNQTSAISSLTLLMSSGNLTSGTAFLYGAS